MSKTELALLAEAREHEGRILVQTGYHADRRGSPHFGDRRFNAAIKLSHKGLITFKHNKSYSHSLIGGNVCHWTDHVFVLKSED